MNGWFQGNGAFDMTMAAHDIGADDVTRSDAVWRELARTDPYWAVLSMPEFRGSKLTPEAKDQFFRSGQDHIGHVLRRCTQLNPHFAPKVALDFGCGVGRLSLAMLRKGMRVIAVDISATMLALCAENCAAAGFHDLTTIASDDTLSRVTEPVDFISSSITFQHIHPSRGFVLVEALLSRLNPGGMFWMQLLFGDGQRNGPGGAGSGTEAEVEMNDYEPVRLFNTIRRYSSMCHLELMPGERLSANFYGMRDRS